MITLKWTKREVAYQFVHMFIGLWAAIIMYSMTDSLWSMCAGSILGLIVEVTQFYTTDRMRWFIFDRVRDWSFWTVGSWSLFLVLLMVK